MTADKTKVDRPSVVTLRAQAGGQVARVRLLQNGAQVEEKAAPDFTFKALYTQSGQVRTDRYEAVALNAAGQEIGRAQAAVEVAITGRIIYVSGSGNDSNSGLSENAPKRTLQAAEALTQPGDTVLIGTGVYSSSNLGGNILTVSRSGGPNAWIAYMGHPGQDPVLKAKNWNAISIKASYIMVEGLKLEGGRTAIDLETAKREMSNLNNPLTSGNGISVDGVNSGGALPKQIVIRNNTVTDFPGGCIAVSRADYVTIEGNRVFRCGYYSPYGNSGISVFQAWNSDQSRETKIIIRGNVSAENYNYIPFAFSNSDPAKRVVTDGNGIIIDDARNELLGSNLGRYLGRILIENNIVYDNGGRGINVFKSDNVDIVNNTSFRNATHPQITSEMIINSADNVHVLNSILVAKEGEKLTELYFANNANFDSNVVVGSNFTPGAGTGNITADPGFVAPDQDDFKLRSGSPAVDAGRREKAAKVDFTGLARPQGAGIDIGALETPKP